MVHTLLLFLFVSLSLPSGAPPNPRPDVLIIVADDLGYGDLACFGNPVIKTPNLDALAKSGTRFTHFYAMSPVCSPSRAAMLTGRYPQALGIHHADLPESLPRYPLPADAPSIAMELQKSGYQTAHIGKWHLGEPPENIEPRKRGFDYFHACLGGRPSSPWIQYARSMNPEVVINEERPKEMPGHVTEVQGKAAAEWVTAADPKRPLMLMLMFNAPHEPLAPLPITEPRYKDWTAEEQVYFQTVTNLDAEVGRVIQALKAKGRLQNTLILFTSDNGPEVHSYKYSRGSAGPLKGMKTQLWEGGIRVPTILSGPGIPKDKVCSQPAGGIDIPATIRQTAGLPIDTSAPRTTDLVRLANGAKAAEPLFFEFHFSQRGVEASLPMAVRMGDLKLMSDHRFARAKLFDLKLDPAEQNDIADKRPGETQKMMAVLKAWWQPMSAKIELKPKTSRVPVPTLAELDKRYYRN